ncbi:hypothetical protein [Muricoccus radiodurans]|uniref:hypothetical protein n=1 Tax=Muricoccus radiodurans TaxID=2231721 RepID=UPI003CEA4B6F
MASTRPLAALEREAEAHERATAPAGGGAYIVRAQFPGAEWPSLRSCGSALRAMQLAAQCRDEGMDTQITTPDGRRLTEDELGHKACTEVLSLSQRAAWGWWTRGQA